MTQPAFVDDVDVDAVAVAVRTCDGVADLYAGRYGEVGTYLPGRRVAGVEIADDLVTVHVRSRWGFPLTRLLGDINTAITPLIGRRTLRLVVADIDDPPSTGPESAARPALPPES